MASSALAKGINYKVNGVRVQKHIESAVAVEGATYLLVSVTMKNTGTTKQSIGGQVVSAKEYRAVQN
jgi:hypothetical protein